MRTLQRNNQQRTGPQLILHDRPMQPNRRQFHDIMIQECKNVTTLGVFQSILIFKRSYSKLPESGLHSAQWRLFFMPLGGWWFFPGRQPTKLHKNMHCGNDKTISPSSDHWFRPTVHQPVDPPAKRSEQPCFSFAKCRLLPLFLSANLIIFFALRLCRSTLFPQPRKTEQRPPSPYDYYVIIDENTNEPLMHVPLVVNIGDEVVSENNKRL